MEIDKIYNCDCLDGMKQIQDNSIDLVLFSPPYDNSRSYHGFKLDLYQTSIEAFRILKDGGIAVIVIQDSTKDFGKSLTSFKTIIDWCNNGFKLFECCIYKRSHSSEGAWWSKRFRVDHEYMPIFLKGERPQYFDKEPLKIPSKQAGKKKRKCTVRAPNGTLLPVKELVISDKKCRGTVWEYDRNGPKLKQQHPAAFPDDLPLDFIKCFCPQNGIVVDPFMGSGTTARAAITLGRHFIGFEISKEYYDLSLTLLNIESRVKHI